MSELPDIQKTAPKHALPIERVGIKNMTRPLVLCRVAHTTWNEDSPRMRTVAKMDAFVTLPGDKKGTHMSRMAIALEGMSGTLESEGLIDTVRELGRTCESPEAEIVLRFPFFFTRRAPVSNLKGTLNAETELRIIVCNANETEHVAVTLAVEVVVTSCCPCSKEISFPDGAHNQRGRVKAVVEYTPHLLSVGAATGDRFFVPIEDLIATLESCGSSRVFGVLKRPDEQFVTREAYKDPKFVEDMVREAYVKLGDMLNDARKRSAEPEDTINYYTVEVTNEESIHLHDAYASMSSLTDANNPINANLN